MCFVYFRAVGFLLILHQLSYKNADHITGCFSYFWRSLCVDIKQLICKILVQRLFLQFAISHHAFSKLASRARAFKFRHVTLWSFDWAFQGQSDCFHLFDSEVVAMLESDAKDCKKYYLQLVSGTQPGIDRSKHACDPANLKSLKWLKIIFSVHGAAMTWSCSGFFYAVEKVTNIAE